MKQIFITGASMTYGVGGSDGGWADMLKLAIHKEQFGSADKNIERCEVYNFAKPTAEVSHVYDSIKSDIEHRIHHDPGIMIVISVGMNNVKAIDNPENFVSTDESFADEMKNLLIKAKSLTNKILFVGYTPIDEAVMTPNISPNTGKKQWWFNERLGKFDSICEKLCKELDIKHVKLFDEAMQMDWKDYLWKDGLHVNDKGHKWIFDKVWPHIKNFW